MEVNVEKVRNEYEVKETQMIVTSEQQRARFKPLSAPLADFATMSDAGDDERTTAAPVEVAFPVSVR